ncbi:MAG: accessory gene regulator ArgB-like protein, partial [Bacteroidota bacterium]
MLARIARQLGDRLARALELPQEAADRAAYALEILFLYILTLAAIALPAFVLGLFWPAMAATLTAGAMRSVSGGAHLNSPWRCIVLSTLVAVFFGLIGHLLISNVTVLTLGILTGIIVVMGTVIILRYCPADTPAKPIPPT